MEANAITEQAEEKLRVLLPVLKGQHVCNVAPACAENPANQQDDDGGPKASA